MHFYSSPLKTVGEGVLVVKPQWTIDHKLLIEQISRVYICIYFYAKFSTKCSVSGIFHVARRLHCRARGKF